MKMMFRLLAVVLVPGFFLLSTTAYSSDYSLVERDLNAGSQNRSPSSTGQSSDNSGSVKLNALSPLAQTTPQNSVSMNPVNGMTSVTPAYGRGVGVQATVFSFQ